MSLEPYKTAREAQKVWISTPRQQRKRILQQLLDAYSSKKAEILDALTVDTRKPKFEALTCEFIPTLSSFSQAISHLDQFYCSKKIPLQWMKHRESILVPVPHGVLLLIAPWNFPLLLSVCDVFHGIAAGNAVVLKPSEFTQRYAILIEKIFSQHLPKGLFQVICGDGATGRQLIQGRPDKVFFTGSVTTGLNVSKNCLDLGIPFNLELGGKDAAIVLEDADLDSAADGILWGALANGGQACASIERVFVDQRIHSSLRELLTTRIASIDHNQLTPPITEAQQRIHEEQDQDARKHHLTVHENKNNLGKIYEGSELTKSKVFLEESFGPCFTLMPFSNDNEAVRLANDSPYGLTAAIFSTNRSRSLAIAKQLHVGTVTINETLYTAGLPETPWGGTKLTGNSTKHGPEGYKEYIRYVHIHGPHRFGWFLKKSPWWFPYTDQQYKVFDALSDCFSGSWINRSKALLKTALLGLKYLFFRR